MPRKTLEAALETADPLTIFAALDALVRISPSVSKLAKDAGADRSMLYRAFRGEEGPRLSLVIRVLSSADFQLIVNANGKRRAKRENLLPISSFVRIQKLRPNF